MDDYPLVEYPNRGGEPSYSICHSMCMLATRERCHVVADVLGVRVDAWPDEDCKKVYNDRWKLYPTPAVNQQPKT